MECLQCKQKKPKSEFTKSKMSCNTCYAKTGKSSGSSSKDSGGFFAGLLDALTDW